MVWECGDVTATVAGWAHIFHDGGGDGRGVSTHDARERCVALHSGIILGRREPAGGSTYQSTIKEGTLSILGDLFVLVDFYVHVVSATCPLTLHCKPEQQAEQLHVLGRSAVLLSWKHNEFTFDYTKEITVIMQPRPKECSIFKPIP